MHYKLTVYACVLILFLAVNPSVGDVKGLDPMCTQFETDFKSSSCCHIPVLLEDRQDLLQKCEKHLETLKEMNYVDLFSKEIRCFSECIFNETGLLKDGKFQTDLAKKLLPDSLRADKEWIPILNDAIAACQDIGDKITNPVEVKDDSCTHVGSLYFGCIDTNLFKNCPASQWSENEQCNKLKQNAEKCPILYAALKQR